MPDQTAVMLLPTQPANEPNRQARGTARKKNEQANSERCLFVTVTPEVLKPVETNEVWPQPIASHPDVYKAIPYAPLPSFPSAVAGPVPRPIPAEPPSVVRDLLLRTPMPAAEWSSPPPPVFGPFGGPIQQLGEWQPMTTGPAPWPSVSVSKSSRLEHLQVASQHLQAAGLTDQVAEVQKEIALERKSEARRELKQRERELKTLQRQIESLRRTLSPEEVPQPE